MKYKAVIFDLFGTLVYNSNWSEQTIVLERMATMLSVPSDDFKNLWRDTFDERMKGVFKDCQACIRHICERLGVSVRDNQVKLAADIRFDMMNREFATPREGATDVLLYLKSNGYKTGLISDCSAETPAIWKNTPFAPLTDVAIFSCEVGMKKPDPRIYQLAIEKLAVNPKECVYIADGIGQELTSASKLGMYTLMVSIPNEIDDDPYREEWNGPVISKLMEVIAVLD